METAVYNDFEYRKPKTKKERESGIEGTDQGTEVKDATVEVGERALAVVVRREFRSRRMAKYVSWRL
jgi:hypothetical protein